MKKQYKTRTAFYVFLVLGTAIVGCGKITGQEIDEGPRLVSICDLGPKMEGEDISVKGEIGIVDTSVPDGIWFEIFDDECQIGAFVDEVLLEMVGSENVLQPGNELTVSGTLINFDGILEIEVFEISGFGKMDSTESDSQASKPEELSFTVTNNETTRHKDITLTVTDAQGNPLPGVEITAQQTDLDFFFDSSYNPNKAFTVVVDGFYDWSKELPDADERKQEYADVGFNTHLIHAQALWTDIEPENNQYVPATGAIATEWVDEGWEYTPDIPGTRFYRANMGPSFANPKSNLRFSGWAPEWIQDASEEEFFAEFEEYLTEIVNRSSTVVGGFHLYDIGVEINNWYATPWQPEPTWFPVEDEQWMKWVEILDWEIHLIKSLDPDSFICLNFDHMGWDPEKYPVHLGPQVFTEALIAKDSPFECIGFEIHPGAYPGEYDTPEFWRGFLDEMESYGKKIYIWEEAVRSFGIPDPTPNWYPTWVPPVAEYTEEYQERVFMEVFKMFMDDPQIVGVALLDYCDDPPELNRESVHFLTSMQAGLLRSDKTQKPLYSSLKDYWHSLFTDYSGTSDENGQVVFNAIPGLFDIDIGGKVVSVHLHADDSIYARETGKAIVLGSSTEASAELQPDDLPIDGMPDAGEAISPCELSEDLKGKEVEVYGIIGFVDIGNEGTFFELKENGCWAGVFISNEEWVKWPVDIQAEITQNSQIVVNGILGKFGEEWEIEMLEPPFWE